MRCVLNGKEVDASYEPEELQDLTLRCRPVGLLESLGAQEPRSLGT
jgi:hypothetical protein